MVPRWSMASCWLMPMPLSVMVSVLAALSKVTRTSRLGASSNSAALFKPSKRSLSQASEALEISSRRKISWLEYSEWVTRCSRLGHFCLERQGLLAHGRVLSLGKFLDGIAQRGHKNHACQPGRRDLWRGEGFRGASSPLLKQALRVRFCLQSDN